MALTGTDRGTGTHNSSATSFTATPASNLSAGALAVLVVAADNASGGGSAFSTFSVSDTKSNTWTRRASPLYDPGTGAAGVEGAIFTTPQNGGALTTGDTITVSFGSTNVVAKAWTLMEVVGSTGKPAFVTSNVNTGSATGAPTVTTSSITSGDMVVGGGFAENTDSWAGDADSTNGSWSTHQHTGIGSGTSAISVTSQRKTVTGTATQTYNPTRTSSDCILAWIQINETPPHATTGALVGGGAAVAGTAAHVVVHATTGALTGDGAAVAGTAAHSTPTLTRFYSSTTSTPPDISPSLAAWDIATQVARVRMSPTPFNVGVNQTSVFFGTTTAPDTTAISMQWVSDPMVAGIAFTTSDKIKGQSRVTEFDVGDNINRQPICVKVVSQDGGTLRATLKALGHYGPNTTEWPLFSFTNRILADGDSLDANYTTVAGDRLVVEIGGQLSAAGGTFLPSGTMANGGLNSDSDLPENESTSPSSIRPWFQFATASPIHFLHEASGALVGDGAAVAGSAEHHVAHATSGALVGGGAAIAGTAAGSAMASGYRSLFGFWLGGIGVPSGTVSHATSGDLVGPGADIDGSAARTRAHDTTGDVVGPGSSVSGTAVYNAKHTTSGALAGPGALVSGSAARTRVHNAVGALTGAGSAIAGTATVNRVHDAAGDIVGVGSEIAGTAARTRAHATTGDLAGAGAVVTGDASHASGPIAHDATGDLVGGGATVAGSAHHTAVHNATGAIAGAGSTLTASASRTRLHATSGALSGAGSTVSGSAARTRIHTTPGVLVGGGATLVGSAAHVVVHTATGDLIGASAILSGAAQHGGAHDTSGDLVGPGTAISGTVARTRFHDTTGDLFGPGALMAGGAAKLVAPDPYFVATAAGRTFTATASGRAFTATATERDFTATASGRRFET